MEPEETTITVYPDGPFLVRGRINLRSEDGTEIKTERPVIALCRCGKSLIRPFCDGTHKKVGFRAPAGREQRGRPAG